MKLNAKTAVPLLVGAGLVAGATTFFFKSRFFSRLLHDTTSDEVLFHGPTTEKAVALTLDDGPHPEVTPQILDVLAAYGVHATFFIIGGRVAGNEALMQRIVREGHEIGNHLMDDRPSITLAPREFERQLKTTHDILSLYAPVRWFRPGSGWYNQRMLDQIRAFGYECVVGSVYPYDAQIPFVEFMANYILGNAQPGSIIILHDGTAERERTAEILHRVLPALQKRGYQIGSLSELTVQGAKQTGRP